MYLIISALNSDRIGSEAINSYKTTNQPVNIEETGCIKVGKNNNIIALETVFHSSK